MIKWIILVEDDEIISCWFYNKPEYLNIPQYEYPTVNTNGIVDPVLRAIEKYKNDSSIRLIKTNNENKQFSFSENSCNLNWKTTKQPGLF